VYGETYSHLISNSKFGLGLLSKRFPELHTTRTFEIPACGTALLTERNEEIEELFNNDEVIYFDSKEELAKRIKFYINHSDILKDITNKGHLRVAGSGYDNNSIIKTILNTICL
jgi:spore maturation protein CgeB